MNVVLIDAGGTNIGSVRYALQRLGVDAPLSSDAETIRCADKVILPGVGAAAPGMARLRQAGLVDVLRGLQQPVLGVCLGMQLLFDHSEESDTKCLGVISGKVTKMQGDDSLRVPHMGWNQLDVCASDPLVIDLPADAHAYFVHSYAAPISPATLASSTHGDAFSAIVRHNNFCGMQFHPERSAVVGAQLLKNFLSL